MSLRNSDTTKYYAVRLGNWVEIRSSAKRPVRTATYASLAGKTFTTVIYEGGKVLNTIQYARFMQRTEKIIPVGRALQISYSLAKRVLKEARR